MKTLILVVLMLVAPSATTDTGSPYKWIFLSPGGSCYDAEGETINFRMWESGTWFVSLSVLYAHGADGGGYWEAHETILYPVGDRPDLIFGDGFDSRTPFSRWSKTEGKP